MGEEAVFSPGLSLSFQLSDTLKKRYSWLRPFYGATTVRANRLAALRSRSRALMAMPLCFLALPVPRLRARICYQPGHHELAARDRNGSFQQSPLGGYRASRPAARFLSFEESSAIFRILGGLSGRECID